MDAIGRAMRWFVVGRRAWVLWPIAIIVLVLTMAVSGVLSNLMAGTLLIAVPIAWLVGLLGVAARDQMDRTHAAGSKLFRELCVPGLWATLYALPVWLLGNWVAGSLWWCLVAYIESERRWRATQKSARRAPGGVNL